MDTLDLEFKFEHKKRKILAKIEKLKEEWQTMWEKCIGNPEAETLAVQVKLQIQIMETEALDDFEQIKREMEELKEQAKNFEGLETWE